LSFFANPGGGYCWDPGYRDPIGRRGVDSIEVGCGGPGRESPIDRRSVESIVGGCGDPLVVRRVVGLELLGIANSLCVPEGTVGLDWLEGNCCWGNPGGLCGDCRIIGGRSFGCRIGIRGGS
jgi:hypothetical protein